MSNEFTYSGILEDFIKWVNSTPIPNKVRIENDMIVFTHPLPFPCSLRIGDILEYKDNQIVFREEVRQGGRGGITIRDSSKPCSCSECFKKRKEEYEIEFVQRGGAIVHIIDNYEPETEVYND